MMYFLSKTWPLLLVAALVGALVSWLLCRRGPVGVVPVAAGCDHEAEIDRLRARVADLEHATPVEAAPVEAAPVEAAPEPDEPVSPQPFVTAPLEAPNAMPVPVSRPSEPEPEPFTETVPASAAGSEPVLDLVAAADVIGRRIKLDDLTVVEGIGPKISELCRGIGVTTWRQLADCPVERLQQMLTAAGPRFQVHRPTSWPQQAALLADGRWAEFVALTKTLRGGREV